MTTINIQKEVIYAATLPMVGANVRKEVVYAATLPTPGGNIEKAAVYAVSMIDDAADLYSLTDAIAGPFYRVGPAYPWVEVGTNTFTINSVAAGSYVMLLLDKDMVFHESELTINIGTNTITVAQDWNQILLVRQGTNVHFIASAKKGMLARVGAPNYGVTPTILAPTGFSYIVSLDFETVTISWTNNSLYAQGIRIYRSETPINPAALPTPIASLGPSATSYIDAAPIPDMTYYYRVESYYDPTSLSALSAELTVSTLAYSTLGLSGDESSNTLILSGDMQAGGDQLKLSGDEQ